MAISSDPQGWSIRPQPVIGKTEVLSTDENSLRRLKDAAEGIASSAVYPAFESGYTHSLFFFDVRPEFVEWIRATCSQMPAPLPKLAARPRSSGAKWAAAAAVLVIAGGLFAAGILPSSSESAETAAVEVADPRANVQATENEPEPKEVSIAYSDTVTIIDDPVPAATPGAGRLDVWFVDVGQGDGIIIRLPSGAFMLIDTNSGADEEVIALLEKLGCKELAAVVMTHPHLDHIGGLPAILGKIKVGAFYDPGFPHTTAIYEKTLRAVEKNGAKYFQPKVGEFLKIDPNVRITVLHSLTKEKNPNNSSIVLKIDFGASSAIFTGDAEAEAEHEMVEKFRGRLKAQLLKSGHHGSRSSSTPEFLAEVAPSIAVISCATGNSYGHPHDITLEKYNRSGMKIFRTDRQGTIHAVTAGAAWSVAPLKGGA